MTDLNCVISRSKFFKMKVMNPQSLTIVLILFFSSFCFGQVGINTTSPGAELDVNGDLIIRNVEKDTDAPSASPGEKALFTNKFGRVVTRKVLPTLAAGNGIGDDELTTGLVVVSTTDGVKKSPVLLSKAFTLEEKSMVTISAGLSYGDVRAADTSKLYTSGENCIIGGNVFFVSGQPAGFKTIIQKINQNFTAYNDGSGDYSTVQGDFNMGFSRTIVLEPGDYEIGLEGLVFVNVKSQHGVSCKFGDGLSDFLDVVAFPIN